METRTQLTARRCHSRSPHVTGLWTPWATPPSGPKRALQGTAAQTGLAAALLAVSACEPGRAQTLDIRGSDSEVNLVQRLAEAFMERHPAIFVSVSGGGSGVGIAALLDGTCDLANSSRRLRPEEHLVALRKGINPVEQVFAMDALTIIVHASNPIDSIDLKTLGALFRREIENWSELGGHDASVVTYGRQTSSGTYLWFREHVVRGPYDPAARQMNGTAQIVDAVARDPGGIGYVSAGYLHRGGRGVRALKVRSKLDAAAVDPLDSPAVLRGSYPLTRPLYHISSGRPQGGVAAFQAFERSAQGQAAILEMGFFPPLETSNPEASHVR